MRSTSVDQHRGLKLGTENMEETPIMQGQLVTVLQHVNMMRGTPEDNTGDTVLIEPDEVLLITSVRFWAKNPHKKWWYVHVIHLDAVYWRLMDTDEIHKAFEKIVTEVDLQDRMLDENDWYDSTSTVS